MLNHKYDPPRQVTIAEFRLRPPGHGVTVELIEKRYGHLLEKRETAEQEDADTMMSLLDKSGSGGPITEYNATHEIVDELKASGWKRNRDFWSRPGRGDDLGQSAKIVETDLGKVLMVYSTAPELERLRSLGKPCAGNKAIVMVSAFDLFAEREHGGDYDNALAAIKQESLTTVAATTVASTPQLPPEFWNARLILKEIQEAAHSRGRPADAVFGAFLGRWSALVPHTFLLPAIVGMVATLDMLIGIVARSGISKTSSMGVARELIPAKRFDDRCNDGMLAQLEVGMGEATGALIDVPVGSGEGLIDAHFELRTVKETDDYGETKTVKRKVQVVDTVLLSIDEGRVLADLDERSSSTLLPTLCSLWSGAPTGSLNASAEIRRVLPQRASRVTAVFALQYVTAGGLFTPGVIGIGFPQRVCWFSGRDELLPPPEDRPEWPTFTLPKPPTRRSYSGMDIVTTLEVAEDVAAEIRLDDHHRQTGAVEVADLDTHLGLVRLKIAGLLATLDERLDVNADDWRLAGMVVDTSVAIRNQIIVEQKRLSADRKRAGVDRAASHRAAEISVEADATIKAGRVDTVAKKIAARVAEEDLTRKQLRKQLHRWEDVLDEAIAYGEQVGMFSTRTVETATGSESLIVTASDV